MGDRVEMLEQKINLLEDELAGKKDAITKFVFDYIVREYGTDGIKNQRSRETILDVFGELYANWDRL